MIVLVLKFLRENFFKWYNFLVQIYKEKDFSFFFPTIRTWGDILEHFQALFFFLLRLYEP